MHEKIRHAYDGIRPTDQQKRKMLRNIVTQMPAEKGKNYTSYPAEPKRQSVIIAGLALLVVCLSAVFLFLKQPQDPPQLSQGDTTPTETQNSDYEEQRQQIMLDLDEKELTYEFLERYRSFVLKLFSLDQKPAPEYYEEYGISCLAGYVSSIDQLGYLITDLDDNGTPEVIISDGEVIYDLYTLDNGEYLHLLSGEERNTYELCEGNFICNTGANGAGSTTYQYFKLNGSELLKEVSLAYEGSAAGESWYLMGGFQYSIQRMPIDEKSASDIIHSYRVIPIEITPFVEREDHEREIP